MRVHIQWSHRDKRYHVIDMTGGENHRRIIHRSSVVFLCDATIETITRNGVRDVRISGTYTDLGAATIAPLWNRAIFDPVVGVFVREDGAVIRSGVEVLFSSYRRSDETVRPELYLPVR